jgi:Protein of unknown function (DUF2605)
MFNSPLPAEPELLKALLQPLLDDFQYWFGRSQVLLESERLTFLTESEQQEVLQRVLESKHSVSVMQSLITATEGQVGVDMQVLMGWHKLVHECWGLSTKYRQSQQ